MNNLEKLAKRGGAIFSTAIIAATSMSGCELLQAEEKQEIQTITSRTVLDEEKKDKIDLENMTVIINPEITSNIEATSTPESTPISESTPTLTPTPEAILTPTLIPEPTPTLTPTPEPIPTLIPTPEVTLNPEIMAPSVMIYRGDASKKEIAFTFDDTGANFDKILTTLKEKGINGTLTLLASEIRNNPERWQQAVADGNLICSHGTSHNFGLCKESEEAIRADLQGWEDAVIEVLGADYLAKFKEETPYFRAPGGNKSATLLKVLGEMGYKYTFYWTTEDCWSMEPANNPNNLTMNQIYIQSTENGAIFLLHPPHQSHVGEIIDEVIAKGYKFVTLGDWDTYYENQAAN